MAIAPRSSIESLYSRTILLGTFQNKIARNGLQEESRIPGIPWVGSKREGVGGGGGARKRGRAVFEMTYLTVMIMIIVIVILQGFCWEVRGFLQMYFWIPIVPNGHNRTKIPLGLSTSPIAAADSFNAHFITKWAGLPQRRLFWRSQITQSEKWNKIVLK